MTGLQLEPVSFYWSFTEIEKVEPERAIRLRAAPPWPQIRELVVGRWADALRTGEAKIAREQSGADRDCLRTVAQFPVGEELLDWFFNSHSGYRAQFRRNWREGLAENERLVTDLQLTLGQYSNTRILPCRLLSPSLVDLGETAASRVDLAASLVPSLAKVWACRDVMDSQGGFRALPLGLTTPRLVLPDGGYWLAISQIESDAYLEIKGAFISPTGPRQPKSPEARAKAIQATGEPGP